MEYAHKSFNKTPAEVPYFKPTESHINPAILRYDKLKGMLTTKVERLNMLHLSVSEEQIVIAEGGLLVAGGDFHFKVTSESNW